MNVTQEQVDNFVKDCRKDISENKMENDHCIILYKAKGVFNEQKFVHKVYKNIDEFESRGLDDMYKIDFSFGIVPQLWYYD